MACIKKEYFNPTYTVTRYDGHLIINRLGVILPVYGDKANALWLDIENASEPAAVVDDYWQAN